MRRARNPCRQLNSEAIKGAALCYLSPIISDKCSIISAKCVSNVRHNGLEGAWLNVCKTRDICDEALKGIQNVAFFFSLIATQSPKITRKKKTNAQREDEENEESNEDVIPSTQTGVHDSQEWLSNHRAIVDKKLSPAVIYLIALTTPSGAPASALSVHRVLLECGVETVATQVKFQENKESMAMKELYKLLKDHSNSFMQDLVSSSFQSTLMKEAVELMDESASQLEIEEYGTESVVRIHLVNKSFQTDLAHAISKLEEKKLHIDRMGFDATIVNANDETARKTEREVQSLSDNLIVLINDVGIAMKELGYAVYRGRIYKKLEMAKYTYSYRCEPRAFVNGLAANDAFKARLLKDMKKVIDVLSDPYREVIRPIIVDYNLIEVQGNHCWSIKQRCFVNSPISDEAIGHITPRAFCSYNHLEDPQPKIFKDILENSLSPSEIESFCEDFLRLLNYNKKQHKDKVPCLIGETNSGKTSLFLPIFGIIHHSNIATITKQRVFNKAMITKNTEVVFIDEATPRTLDVDDWKILTQGGYAAHDVKYQTAKSFINRCPMIITAQKRLEFGSEDQAAMDRRLRTYTFKSLTNPKKKAAEWLRKHPMDCIVWAASKARLTNQSDQSASETEDDDTDIDEETLKECEKEELRNLPLRELLTKKDVPDSQEEEPEDGRHETQDHQEIENRQVAEGQEDQNVSTLRQCAPGSLRFWQINFLLQGQTERIREERETQEREYRRRKEVLLGKGVSKESVDLLPRDGKELMPLQIQEELVAIHQRLVEEKEREQENKIKTAFENPWVEKTKRQLQACVSKLQLHPTNAIHRKSAHSFKEILVDKLKSHFTNLGLIKCEKAILERRKKCIEWGLLEESLQHLVTSVHDALPLTQVIAETDGEASSESEEMANASNPSQSLLSNVQSQDNQMKRTQQRL